MPSMVSKDVRKEPTLSTTPMMNSELILVCVDWEILQRVFVDLRDFYAFTPSYQNQLLAAPMKTVENQKKRKHNQ